MISCLIALPLRAQVGPEPRRELIIHGSVLAEETAVPLQATLLLSTAVDSDPTVALSDSAGFYQLRSRGGDLMVTAFVSGYLSETRWVYWPEGISGGDVRLDFRLRTDTRPAGPSNPSCAVPGRVLDQDSEGPVWSARISLELPNQAVMEVQSNTDGRFIIVNVPSGMYVLRARRIGYEDESRLVIVHCDGRTGIAPVTYLMREKALWLF